MSSKRKSGKSREEWLSMREAQGIGGSEAAAVVGLSPYMTTTELWKLKTGQAKPKDISSDFFVSRGVKYEPVIRNAFKELHKEYIVEYHPFDMLYQEDTPYIFATLDGEIIERETNRRGILEIKTSEPSGKAGWDNWREKVPMHYYTQLLHQMLATGYDFAILVAALFTKDESITIRKYEFERSDCEDDLAWLLDKEKTFWRSVQAKTLPPMTIVF